ncbi:hypothetical protein SDC9_124394 [bioreactor metagenome]|uniref:Uncharacterized protein n=1 Tax=bioreactor metagenome TaxID=1076179 RepID=A0A645CKA5_9ZZZZ
MRFFRLRLQNDNTMVQFDFNIFWVILKCERSIKNKQFIVGVVVRRNAGGHEVLPYNNVFACYFFGW